MAALERAVGEKLIERPGGPRAVSLTEAGELLLRHAEAIVARMKAAQADLAAFAEGAAGPLRVGTYQSVSARLLPTLVRSFKEQFPMVDVQLSESAIDDELEARLERGEVDLSFVMLPMREAPLEAAQLLVDPYVLIVQAGLAAGRAREAAVATRDREAAADRLPAVPEQRGGRDGDPPRGRRAALRLPLGRQRHGAGPRRRGHRRRARPAADVAADRRDRRDDRDRQSCFRRGSSASRGTATAIARPPRARSSTWRRRSAPMTLLSSRRS